MTFRPGILALVLIALTFGTAANGNAASQRVEADMLDGSHYVLGAAESGLTLLSFWSPDSLASRKCIWELQRFASAFESRGVRTIAVSTMNDAGAVRGFVEQRKLSLQVGLLAGHDLGTLDENDMPLVHVYDRDGKLLAVRRGMFSYASLERLVQPFMK